MRIGTRLQRSERAHCKQRRAAANSPRSGTTFWGTNPGPGKRHRNMSLPKGPEHPRDYTRDPRHYKRATPVKGGQPPPSQHRHRRGTRTAPCCPKEHAPQTRHSHIYPAHGILALRRPPQTHSARPDRRTPPHSTGTNSSWTGRPRRSPEASSRCTESRRPTPVRCWRAGAKTAMSCRAALCTLASKGTSSASALRRGAAHTTETGVGFSARRTSAVGDGYGATERGRGGDVIGGTSSDASTDSVARGVLRTSANSATSKTTRIPKAPEASATSRAMGRTSDPSSLTEQTLTLSGRARFAAGSSGIAWHTICCISSLMPAISCCKTLRCSRSCRSNSVRIC